MRIITTLSLLLLTTTLQANNYSQRSEVDSFIQRMTAEHGFERAVLLDWFAQIKIQQQVLDQLAKPAERVLTWAEYRPIFITEKQIKSGVNFWREHAAILQRAEKVFGVPPELIVAIIGVESRYGSYTGTHPVFASLTTLAFDGSSRQDFFERELEQFLLLVRQENLQPLQIKGSYAGAMGMPQFISSSYRNYAIDFSNDGKRDLWQSPEDVIGSVANYFKQHGWQSGEIITVPAKVQGEPRLKAIGRERKGLKPNYTVAELAQAEIISSTPLPQDTTVSLIELENAEQNEYWLGLQNFYVITRYNHSVMYAMAVYQLAQQIRQAYQIAQ